MQKLNYTEAAKKDERIFNSKIMKNFKPNTGTAVQKLEKDLLKLFGENIPFDVTKIIKKAKSREKHIITEAYSQGRIDEETRFPYATDGEDYFKLEFTQSSE